jgi:hypothetical protein
MRGLTNRCGDREKQRMACLNRTGRNQATARANIVTWAVTHRHHGGINPLGWPPPAKWLQPSIGARSTLHPFQACRRATTMDVLGELHAVAAKLSPYEDRPTCECCGQGRLELIDERPDPIFGVLGMSCQTLKCDFLGCGKLTIV